MLLPETTRIFLSVSVSLSGHLFSTVLSSTLKSIDPNVESGNRDAQNQGNEHSSPNPHNPSANNNNINNSTTSIKWQKDGPLPLISDSVFSLIILIYVGVIFVFMFFSFCWKEPEPPPPDPAHKNIPMITSLLEEMERKEAALSKEPLVDISEELEDESNNAHTSSIGRGTGGCPPGQPSSMKQGTEMTLMKPEIISHPELNSFSSFSEKSDGGESSNSGDGLKEDGSAILAATCV